MLAGVNPTGPAGALTLCPRLRCYLQQRERAERLSLRTNLLPATHPGLTKKHAAPTRAQSLTHASHRAIVRPFEQALPLQNPQVLGYPSQPGGGRLPKTPLGSSACFPALFLLLSFGKPWCQGWGEQRGATPRMQPKLSSSICQREQLPSPGKRHTSRHSAPGFTTPQEATKLLQAPGLHPATEWQSQRAQALGHPQPPRGLGPTPPEKTHNCA